jgi:hypothetical protein
MQVPSVEIERLRVSLSDPDSPTSLLEQLTSGAPPIVLLEAVKHFARYCEKNPDSALQGIPATVIYYATLAAAAIHHHAPFTQLSVAEMEQGFRWAKDQAGAERLSPLFEKALYALKNSAR